MAPTKKPAKKNKFRLNVLIFPKFQIPLILVNSALIIVAFAFVWMQAYRSYAYLHELGATAQLPADHVYYEFVNLQAKTLYRNLGWATLATLVTSAATTLYLSFRFAGPLVRLQGYFQSIVDEGRISAPLSFRRGDFLSELPPVVNRALHRVNQPANGSGSNSGSNAEAA